MKPFLFLNLLFIILQGQMAFAQNDHKATVTEIASSVTKFANDRALEKIYLQTDKSFYAINDTLWFKAYLFNASNLTESQKSGIVYIEIADEQNTVVKRFMVSLHKGLGWGNISLNDREFPAGSYCLRAYTNWMRNFDEHYIFKKQFYISSPGEKDLLIKSHFDVKLQNGKQKVEAALQVNKIDQQLLILGDFQLAVSLGSKTWFKDKIQTGLDGTVGFNFDLPEKTEPNKLTISLKASDKKEEKRIYNIPVILNRPENIDLQFMPEGGYLVNGINTHIAFKAVAEDGTGVNVYGKIYNSKQQEVLTFQSAHLGIGSFNFLPLAGEVYTAKIKLPDGTWSKPYPLPGVKPSGLVLNVINKLDNDSLEVMLTAAGSGTDGVYYLVGQSRGIGCVAAILHLNGHMSKIKFSKTLFPTGIARFTLFNVQKQPLHERIVYINHNDHLSITLTTNKHYYVARDSVGIDVLVTDKDGKPVRSDFSVAVTDDAQVKNDSLKSSSLKSSLLLTSDLNGTVEDPGYYFPDALTPAIWQHLDNLLLAQGWVNYDWTAVFQPAISQLNPAEELFSVTGKVTNVANKPVEKSLVLLLSKKPAFVMDTITDKTGTFNFTNIYPSDTSVYFIQSRNKNGKSFNVDVNVDEFKPPVLTSISGRNIPWYVNIDSSKIKTVNTFLTYKKEQEKFTTGHMLKEVKTTDKKIIKGSHNLNGPGESDLTLNEDDMQKAGKMTLGDLLKKNIKGFGIGGNIERVSCPYCYLISHQYFNLIIDGISIDITKTPDIRKGTIEYMNFVKSFLDYYTAEDIKGIEVMRYGNTVAYVNNFVGFVPKPFNYAFVEVTTRGGNGPFLKKTQGTYLYKPISFAPQKQFYSPKYSNRDDKTFIDTRSTIYWSPNIITNENGTAKFSFYTADKPGTYTLLIEGCDMNGNLESTRQKIVVK